MFAEFDFEFEIVCWDGPNRRKKTVEVVSVTAASLGEAYETIDHYMFVTYPSRKLAVHRVR